MAERLDPLSSDAAWKQWAESYLSGGRTETTPQPDPIDSGNVPPTREQTTTPLERQRETDTLPTSPERTTTTQEWPHPYSVRIVGESPDGHLQLSDGQVAVWVTRHQALSHYRYVESFQDKYNAWRQRRQYTPDASPLSDPARLTTEGQRDDQRRISLEPTTTPKPEGPYVTMAGVNPDLIATNPVRVNPETPTLPLNPETRTPDTDILQLIAQNGDNDILREFYASRPEYAQAFADYDRQAAERRAAEQAQREAEAQRQAQLATDPENRGSGLPPRGGQRHPEVARRGDLNAFKTALAGRESGGKYYIENRYGFLGKYQFGTDALKDLGYIGADGKWTGKDGIRSAEDFKRSPQAQERAMDLWVKQKLRGVKRFERYVGQTVRGVPITRSGLVAGAHLVGTGGIEAFFNPSKCRRPNGRGGRGAPRCNSAGIPVDGNNTPITVYMRKFAGYSM